MFSPLNNLTIAARKKTPNFTMIPDGVHPAAPGQVVMAVAILEDIVPRTQCTQIVVDEKAGKLAPTASGGKVTDFNGTADSVSFTFAAEKLPWVLPPEAVDGYKMTHAGHHYSNEKVSVRGLKPGKYTLKIDGQTIGSYASGQLAFGVELEENDKTPEYQQALKVALLNKQRNDLAYHPLRDQYAQLKGKRRELAKIDEKDPQYAAKKAEFETWYAGQKAKVAELLAQAKGIEDQILPGQPACAAQVRVRTRSGRAREVRGQVIDPSPIQGPRTTTVVRGLFLSGGKDWSTKYTKKHERDRSDTAPSTKEPILSCFFVYFVDPIRFGSCQDS
ncbi:MAG: hypothetical protein WDN28_01360 [Chthoniobacter sp.]